jgi:hypothetical protein
MKGINTMPNNELKNRVRFSTTLDKEIEKKLKKCSEETMVPISKLTDKAFVLLFEALKK